ncbi:hypothetical protein [Sphingomonas sp. CFBP 13603]|nr:hypothetical protein [Sphingomonas sp. CFBP 13603]
MILVMGHIKLATGEGAKIADTLIAHMAACAGEDGCEFTISRSIWSIPT